MDVDIRLDVSPTLDWITRRAPAFVLAARRAATLAAAEKYAEETRDRIRSGRYLTSRSGTLLRSVAVRRDGDGATVSVSAPYASHLEFGTGLYGPKRAKYPIRPKRAQMLRFERGGKIIFARSVMHPGIRGRHFLAPGRLLPGAGGTAGVGILAVARSAIERTIARGRGGD